MTTTGKINTKDIKINPEDFWYLLAKKGKTKDFMSKLAVAGLSAQDFDDGISEYGVEAFKNGTMVWFDDNDAVNWPVIMADVVAVLLQYHAVLVVVMASVQEDIKEELLDKLAKQIFHNENSSIKLNVNASIGDKNGK